MTTYELVKDAHVVVDVGQIRNKSFVEIDVNDKYTHRFPVTSRISKALDVSPVEDIQARLNGGSFFFVNNHLVDFRDSAYRGFIHTDESINSLMDVLGTTTKQRGSGGLINHMNTTQPGPIMLGRSWNETHIEIPAYKEGGDFKSNLFYTWNPFHQNIKSVFELVRLICTNGMVGLASFLNTNIPLVNRWQEHLDMATMQIQHKVEDKVTHRLADMSIERATVADLALIANHAHERLTSSAGDSDTLREIFKIANPMFHLYDHYKPTVFTDKRLAAQLPGHMTAFDAWNMATELSSHTEDGGNSTNNGLQKLANDLVFSPHTNVTAMSARYDAPPVSRFSNPEQAYFGRMAA